MRGFCAVLMLATLLPVSASALTVEELDIGEHIRGPKLTVKDFVGKVVLVDLWGVQCGPCIAQMPALQELYRKYRPAGFHIVALERQAPTREVANQFFANSPNFRQPIYEFDFTYAYGIPIPGRHVLNLPANFLFGADGQLIASDLHGEELELKVQEALVDAFANMIDAGEIVVLTDIEAKLKSGDNMMVALSELVRRKKEATDEKVVAEATRLFSAVFAWANKRYDKAMAEKERDPVNAVFRLNTIVRQLKGTEIAERAAKAMQELRKDERVQKAESAEKELRMLLAQISDLKPTAGGKRDPEDKEFLRVNAAALRVLGADCQRLATTYAGTEAAEYVKSIAREYKLKEIN